MPDYQYGKIYKIYNTNNPEKCYVGSTCQCLCERMRAHKATYKHKKRYTTSHCIFQEGGGTENCVIELVEDYPCSTREELNAREGHWIRQLNCVNRIVMGRSPAQYRLDNKDHKRVKDKEYREAHKEQYKRYYEERKARLANSGLTYKCEDCSYETIRKDTFNRHIESKRHLKKIQKGM